VPILIMMNAKDDGPDMPGRVKALAYHAAPSTRSMPPTPPISR